MLASAGLFRNGPQIALCRNEPIIESQPRPELAIDFLMVGARVAATQILAHQPNAGIEKFKRQPEGARGSRFGGHGTNCSVSDTE
jgi:hypothetical protein